MNKYELYDIDNCYVCGEYMGPFKNELTVATGYSEKTIQQIIETFLDSPSPVPEFICKNGGICQNCFIKFNEYDEHQSIAQMILSELSSMLRIRESYVDIKQEECTILKEGDVEYSAFDPVTTLVEIPHDAEYVVEKEEEAEEEGTSIITYQAINASEQYDLNYSEEVAKTALCETQQKRRSGYVRKDKDAGFIITIIDNVKHYTCEVCLKHFISRARLRSHRQIHSTERNFMCQDCGSKFKTLNCLKNHTRNLHSNIFFYCDLCDSKFKGKHELRCHLEAVHLKKKDHICQLCGKAFSRDKTLRQHLLYHLNERNIVCEICGFKTINRPKMARHQKSHTGQRDFACSICGKRFLYSYNVTAHIKHVHYHEKRPSTSEEKLMCKICNKRFQKIWKVKEHMRQFHNICEETIETTEIDATTMHIIDQ